MICWCPNDWGNHSFFPIYKLRKKRGVKNYRLVICKFEHIIVVFNRKEFENNWWFVKGQYVFRNVFPCECQIVSIFQGFLEYFDRGSRVGAVGIDFTKPLTWFVVTCS